MTIAFNQIARFVALACVLVAGLASAPAAGAAVDHSAFDAILKANVRDERVDYANIKATALPQLDAYLDMLANVRSTDLAGDERLAFYFNLYNATVIRNVIDRYKPGYTVSENGFTFFKEPLVRLDGNKVSLDALEHQVARPAFDNEPRIHVGLVCAGLSCPTILPRAYRADDLQAVLDENMKRFVNDPKRNAVAGKTWRLSQVFEWFAGDFGGKDAVAAYASKWAAGNPDPTGVKIEHLVYDWTLNEAK